MTSRILFLSLLCLSLSLYGPYGDVLCAEQEFFPFLAEVTGDQVNVRAGQSANFERLHQLNKGDEVIVVDKEYSWYKIQLPSRAKSFVYKNYIQYLGQNAGGVNADHVNIRAGAGVHFTILGQLTKGEQIYIQEELDEWYRIQPVVKSYGWVADQFLVFKSRDVVESQTIRISEPFIKEEPEDLNREWLLEESKELFSEHPLEMKTVDEIAVMKKGGGGVLSFVGHVELYEDGESDGIYYKIVMNGQPVCYVKGFTHMLSRFVNHRVKVDGAAIRKLRNQYAHPVITVSKFRLML